MFSVRLVTHSHDSIFLSSQHLSVHFIPTVPKTSSGMCFVFKRLNRLGKLWQADLPQSVIYPVEVNTETLSKVQPAHKQGMLNSGPPDNLHILGKAAWEQPSLAPDRTSNEVCLAKMSRQKTLCRLGR